MNKIEAMKIVTFESTPLIVRYHHTSKKQTYVPCFGKPSPKLSRRCLIISRILFSFCFLYFYQRKKKKIADDKENAEVGERGVMNFMQNGLINKEKFQSKMEDCFLVPGTANSI